MIRHCALLAAAALLLAFTPLHCAPLEGPPICPHANEWTSPVAEWAKGATWIKVLYAHVIPAAKDTGAYVFYRPWDQKSGPDGDTAVGGKRMGREVLDNLNRIPKDKWPDAISFQNEFNNVSPEAAQAFLDYYDTLRDGGYTGLIVFGSYGPGGPTDITEWERPHIRACVEKADGIETHEYWDLTIKHYDTWLAHRHVRMMEKYPWLSTKPWFIGEFGSDGVNKGEDSQNRSGWRDRDKLTAEDYIRQIEIYRKGDKETGVVAPSPNIIAVFLYQQGSPGWQKWETMGTPVADYMKTTWKQSVGHVRGMVLDSAGKPMPAASVTLAPGGQKAVSDAQGRFWFFSLTAGRYTVNAKLDKKSVKASVDIRGGGVAQCTLQTSGN